jgi:hypothetical protein
MKLTGSGSFLFEGLAYIGLIIVFYFAVRSFIYTIKAFIDIVEVLVESSKNLFSSSNKNQQENEK